MAKASSSTTSIASAESVRTILVGKGGAGKDFLRQKMEARGFVYQVSYTTRPPRPGEVNGREYWFLSEKEAETMEKQNEWSHVVTFNGWRYGTTKTQFYNQSTRPLLFIMTPDALKLVSPADRAKSFVIFLDPPQSVICERLQQRKMPGDTCERRIQADLQQFQGFSDYDIVIRNCDF